MLIGKVIKFFFIVLAAWFISSLFMSETAYAEDMAWSQWCKLGVGIFNSPSGVAVDMNGDIYVADTDNHQIQKLAEGTNTWTKWTGFGTPGCISVDNSGNVYATDISSNSIYKLPAGGNEWTVLGSGYGTSPGKFYNPKGIAVDKDGNVYVADTGNDRIQKLVIAKSAWTVLKTGLNSPEGVAVDDSGNIYAADTDNNRIQKFSASSDSWTVWKTGFSFPGGITVDGSSNVYVSDTGNNRIQKFSPNADLLTEWEMSAIGTGTGLGEFKGPKGIAVDKDGNLYVADKKNNRIQKLMIKTNSWSEWSSSLPTNGLGVGEFNGPYDIAIDSSGNLYAADKYNNRIQKLVRETNTWTEWKTLLNYPSGIAVDSSGYIYVADTGSSQIEKYSPEGTLQSKWGRIGGGSGSGQGEFNGPEDITVDSLGNIYVADTGNNRVQKLPAGQFTWTIWVGFSSPKAIATDRMNNVYAADTGNNRIQKLMAQGNEWFEWKTGFNSPNGIAVDILDNVYVADTKNYSILMFSPSGEVLSEWGKSEHQSGAGLEEFYGPRGIAVDSCGIMYIADTGNNRIQRASPLLTISGSAGIPEVILSYRDGGITKTVTADNNGNYTLSVPCNWTGSIIPLKKSYIFTPLGKSYVNVTESQTCQDYTANASGKLSAASGGNGSISINGGTEVNSYDCEDLSETEILLKAVPDEGYSFAYWQDADTLNIISTNADYECYIGAGINMKAVFFQDPTNETNQFMVIFKDKSGKILKDTIVDIHASATPPISPVLIGYEFTGWDKDYTNVTSNMIISAVYRRLPDVYMVTVAGGTLSSGGTSGSYRFDMPFTIRADAAPSGQKFSHWLQDGQKVSIDSEDTFYTPKKDTAFTAVFVNESVVLDNTPFIAISSDVLVDDINKTMLFTVYRCVPVVCTLVESGIIVIDSTVIQDQLTIDTVNAFRGRIGNGSSDQFYVRKNNIPSGAILYARAYLIYKDSGGNVYTVYSDTVNKKMGE